MAPDAGGGEFGLVWFVVGNIIASVCIILCNKQIASVCEFHFLLTLIFLNFVFTGGVTHLLAHYRQFKVKHLPMEERVKGALLGLVTILMNNACTEANSVGFYQITKLLIVPTVMGLDRLEGNQKSYSAGVIAALLLTACGVGAATVSDFEVNIRGTILAGLSIVFTAKYQMWQSFKAQKYELSGTQITYSVAFHQCMFSFVFALFFDVAFPSLKRCLLLRETGSLLAHKFHSSVEPCWIFLCCLIAVGMNLSTFGLLGKTSPVTYQVVGQVKTCIIIISGYLIFDLRAPTAFWLGVRFGGAAVGVIGAFTYAMLKHRDNAAAADLKKQ